uniref:F-box domain-containing protein n=1 Tax=Panagrellus redivivus TaxID=6233 RepID=A0A7E4UTZ3_PANRE
MTTAPQLKNHLIRELMHDVRLKRNEDYFINGDTMVLLALSGKEPFSVFKYVVGTHVIASSETETWSLLTSGYQRRAPASIKFLFEGSKRLAIRFVRDLIVDIPLSKDLPFEKITNLTVNRYANPLSSVRIPWADLEVLKMCNIPDAASDGFFKDFIKTPLPNLRKLELGLTLNGCMKLLTMTPPVSLPEDVTFLLTVSEDALAAFGSPNTFPSVKRFVVTAKNYAELTAERLVRLSTVISCFPSLETAKIAINYSHTPLPNDFANVVNFHEWLRNTEFSTAVEINCEELVDISRAYNLVSRICRKLKSIGYEEFDDEDILVIKKEYGNVQLNHRINHCGGTSFLDEYLNRFLPVWHFYLW